MAVYSQTSWQGGIANDEYLTDATQFSHCEDVNIYESSAYFKLGPAKTSTNLTDGQDYRCKMKVGSTGYIAGGDGATAEGIFALEATPAMYISTSGKDPINSVGVTQMTSATVGEGFIITNKGGLYWWAFDSGASYGNFTDGGLTNVIAPGTIETRYSPYVINGEFLYYAYLNKVYAVNTGTWTQVASASGTTPILSLDSSSTITNLFLQGNTIVIYANDGVNSEKLFWDGSSENIAETISLKSKKIINVSNFGNYELIQYSTNKQYSVGMLEGYDLKPIYSSDYPYSNMTRGFQGIYSQGTGDTALGDNLIAFGRNSTSLYTLGNFKPGKPLALSLLVHDSGGDIGLIDGDGFANTIYSRYSNTIGFKVTYSSTTFDSSGYLITKPIVGKALSIQKTAKKIQYGYELQTGSKIKIYYQFDENSNDTLNETWTLLDTITVGSDFAVGNGYRAKNIDGKFYQARFKIVLETSNSSYSPKLFDFHFEYDETSTEL